MTRLRQEAFDQVSRLDESEQDAVARWLLDGLSSERRWDEAFEKSQDTLAALAAEALDEHGGTRRNGPKS